MITDERDYETDRSIDQAEKVSMFKIPHMVTHRHQSTYLVLLKALDSQYVSVAVVPVTRGSRHTLTFETEKYFPPGGKPPPSNEYPPVKYNRRYRPAKSYGPLLKVILVSEREMAVSIVVHEDSSSLSYDNCNSKSNSFAVGKVI